LNIDELFLVTDGEFFSIGGPARPGGGPGAPGDHASAFPGLWVPEEGFGKRREGKKRLPFGKNLPWLLFVKAGRPFPGFSF